MAHSSHSRRKFSARRRGLLAVPFGRAARAQAKCADVTLRSMEFVPGAECRFHVAQDKWASMPSRPQRRHRTRQGVQAAPPNWSPARDPVGFPTVLVVGNSVSKGMSIRTVAHLPAQPTAVIVLADSDIKTPKDLEEKASRSRRGRPSPEMAAFAKGCGVDASKVRVVSIDTAVIPRRR